MTNSRSPLHTVATSPWTHEDAWAETRQPIHAASALPADCYIDPRFFAAEQQQVFGTAWVAVGPATDAPDPGRMLVRDVGGSSVLITRNADGDLRAFRNSCRHRGTQLAEADCDIASTIRCPYHRWGYNLDGGLVSTPRFDEAGVDNFDRGDFSLHQVRVGVSCGLLFVCLSDDTPSLAQWLGDLPQRLSGYNLDQWHERHRRVLEIPANWKLISENFQEYYHLTWVHPELAKVSRVDDHYRYQGPGMYCGQTTTPVSADERGDWTAMPPAPGLTESDANSGRFLAIFPNILLSVLPNHVFIMLLDPVAPGLTRETCVFLLPPTGKDVAEEDFDVTRRFWFDVNDEDIDIVSRGQRGLTSGGYTPGRLSPRFEEPLHRFHNMLAGHFVGNIVVPEGDDGDHQDLYGSGINPSPWRPEPKPN